MTIQPAATETSDRTLVVMLHAYTGTSEDLTSIEDATRFLYKDRFVNFHRPNLPLSLLSFASPSLIAENLVNEIEEICDFAEMDNNAISRIIFIGHSIGSLIARKAYVIACGETEDAPFEAEIKRRTAAKWAPKVDRIILLAGMNRGWRISHHLSLKFAPFWWTGSVIGNFLEVIFNKPLLIMQVRLGATFITQLRIQWIRMRQNSNRNRTQLGSCLTIQLLGSVDDYVSPKDNIDLVSGGDFIYLDVPYSGHANVVKLNDSIVPPGRCESRGRMRHDVFIKALTLPIEKLKQNSIVPDDSDTITKTDNEIQDVIFVVHGIRDEGYWTHKVARSIQSRMPHGTKTIATETASYGYFPMLPFLLSRKRRVKVEWLMDRYATAIATYPEAKRFHFVGHSNGTYCLAEALRLYQCCKFEHVVFAGSVIRRNFNWRKFLDTQANVTRKCGQTGGTVKAVLNFTATGDWVVAIFPKLFQSTLPIQKLGSAGHDGFKDPPVGVEQIGYVIGGHGAAVAEPIWPAIADFIATGQAPVLAEPLRSDTRTPWVWLIGLFPWAAWLLLILVACALGYYIFPSPGQSYEQILTRSGFFAVYVGIIFKSLTWL